MATLYPIMLNTAINLGILSSVFIKMMTDTMGERTEWDSKEKTSYALLCMLGLGAGEILGALAWGKIIDKCPTKVTVLINVLAVTVSFAFLILYATLYKFTYPLALLMTFSLGV